MISEIEARTTRHALMHPRHPVPLGRALAPLMVWLAFFGIAIIGSVITQPTPRLESSVATSSGGVIAQPTIRVESSLAATAAE